MTHQQPPQYPEFRFTLTVPAQRPAPEAPALAPKPGRARRYAVLLTLAALPAAAITVLLATGVPVPPASMPAAYDRAIDKIAPHCAEGVPQLEAEIRATRQIEYKAGVKDESLTQLAVSLAKFVSGNPFPEPCAPEFATYAHAARLRDSPPLLESPDDCPLAPVNPDDHLRRLGVGPEPASSMASSSVFRGYG